MFSKSECEDSLLSSRYYQRSSLAKGLSKTQILQQRKCDDMKHPRSIGKLHFTREPFFEEEVLAQYYLDD
jgi:hypothetical protein